MLKLLFVNFFARKIQFKTTSGTDPSFGIRLAPDHAYSCRHEHLRHRANRRKGMMTAVKCATIF
jgi:hypothetical protein